MTTFIGDVHGKFTQYRRIIQEHPDSIQVGDMGIGFLRYPHGERQQNPPYDEMVATNAQFIRGNHDNPSVCKTHTQWIPDGRVHGDMMFVGGAHSIDWKYRTEGFSWWKDEELSREDMEKILDVYMVTKPVTMVTHDCPLSVIKHLPHTHHFADNSRTQQFLQILLEVHKPKLWVHGHHHLSSDQVIDGVRFVCLAELEVKEL